VIDEVLLKIKKLLALGQSSNPHEAASAAAMAQRLMDKNAITEAMLGEQQADAEPGAQVWKDPLHEAVGKAARWYYTLGTLLAKVNNAKAYTVQSHKNRLVHTELRLIGRARDVQTVRYLFQFCAAEINRLAGLQAGNGKTYINNFRLGVVDGIYEQLITARRKAEEEMRENAVDLKKLERAIVRVDERAEVVRWEVERLAGGLGLKTVHRTHTLDADARELGRREGRKIPLGSGPGLGEGARGALKG
jgi:hypothetical protein